MTYELLKSLWYILLMIYDLLWCMIFHYESCILQAFMILYYAL